MVTTNVWEDFEHPAVAGLPPHHQLMQDIRRRLWLASKGHFANEAGAEFAAKDEDNFLRFASDWKNWMSAYPTANVSNTIERNGSTIVDRDPQFRPGSVIVYHERSFSHSIQGVVLTGENYEFKFNATGTSKHTIYNQNGSVVDFDADSETIYKEQDNFRPGTPFIVSGSANSANDRFYRVRSVRRDGSYVYVIADNNEYEQQELVVCGAGGSASCNFGGDWYTLRGGNGNSGDDLMTAGGRMNAYFSGLADNVYAGGVRDRWWCNKDIYHRYEQTSGEVTYGPNDGRPPDGGPASADFNGDWVRCPNPNLYHTWDINAHRWHIEAETDGSISANTYVQYTALIPSWKFLSTQVDPKEQKSPFYFMDTKRIHWKYGSKVGIRADQITNPAKLGAIQDVQKNGWVSDLSGRVGTSTDHQYNTTYIVETTNTSSCSDGYIPPMSGQNTWNKWINNKYDTSLQVMVEHVATLHGWRYPVDTDYKNNWLWLRWDTVVPEDHERYYTGVDPVGLTYGQMHTAYGLSGAYNPKINPYQPQLALMTDEEWGENCSVFELLLKLYGHCNFYYDDSHPFMPARVLNYEYVNSNPPYYSIAFPRAVGTIRRTWEEALGRVQNKMIRRGARGGLVGVQNTAVYDTYSVKYIGRNVYAGDEPEAMDFADWSITGYTRTGSKIRVTGNVTDKFKPGYKVFRYVSNVGTYYTVLKAIYDTVGGYTDVTFDASFATDAPSTLYGSIELSEKLDGIFHVNNTTAHQKHVYSICNACRDVLKYLKYHDVASQLQFGNGQIQCGTYNTLSGEDDDYEDAGGASHDPTMLGCWSKRREIFKKRYYDADLTTDLYQASACMVGSHFLMHYESSANPPYWECGTGISGEFTQLSVGTLQARNLPFKGDLSKIVHAVLKVTNWNLPWADPGGIKSRLGNLVSENGFPVYGYISVDPDKSDLVTKDEGGNTTHHYVFWPYNHDFFCRVTLVDDEDPNDIYAYGTSECTVECVDAENLCIEFDWDKFPDAVWNRTKERADYKPIDSFGPDRKPPVARNEWVIVPTLYDANAAQYVDSGVYPYDINGYMPEWTIKAECVLMEDLEGNGVEYIFDFSPTSMDTLFSKVQSSRKYSEALGDDSDVWGLTPAVLESTEIVLNSKDCYSGSIPAEPDNYGTALAAVSLELDAPMCPLKPSIESAKHYHAASSTWYDHLVIEEPWSPDGVNRIVYKWNIATQEWDEVVGLTSRTTSPYGGSTWGDIWLASTELEDSQYKVRYFNADSGDAGIMSDIAEPLA
jgi:hypothetical protein